MSSNVGAQGMPSWLPGGSAIPSAVAPAPAAAAEAVAAAPAPGADPALRTYAEWFAWARRNLTEPARCHAAAAAAVVALAEGQDHAAAARLAQAAALAPDASVRPISADRPTQAYATWYAFAHVDHGLDSARAHAYAAAATLAHARGADTGTAAATGAAAAGIGPAPAPAPAVHALPAAAPLAAGRPLTASVAGVLSIDSLVSDPAVRAIFWGGLALVLPFLIHWYFPFMPVVGLVLSMRAFGRSHQILALAGLAINGVALLLTAAIFFGLH